MLKDRRLPRLRFRECRADDGFKDEQDCGQKDARHYILRFDIAGGDPKNVALYCGGQPVAFVNRCGYAVGEGLYINGVIYLEQDGEGYCFVSGELPRGKEGYSVYECRGESLDWLSAFRTDVPLIGMPKSESDRPRMVCRRRQRVNRVKGGYQ